MAINASSTSMYDAKTALDSGRDAMREESVRLMQIADSLGNLREAVLYAADHLTEEGNASAAVQGRLLTQLLQNQDQQRMSCCSKVCNFVKKNSRILLGATIATAAVILGTFRIFSV